MISHDDHKAEATVDETENYNLFWGNAQSVLDRADAGEVKIIFPTKRNLERLAQFGSFDEAVAHSKAHPSVMVSPSLEKRDGLVHLCIPEGIGYPVTSEPMDAVQRGRSLTFSGDCPPGFKSSSSSPGVFSASPYVPPAFPLSMPYEVSGLCGVPGAAPGFKRSYS